MAVKSTGQITILDVTDAYSVMLTSETYTFVGGTGGVAAGQKCTTEVVAFCGNTQCPKVTVDKTKIVLPTGISAAVENSGTSMVTITFTTTAIISSDCEATIPVAVDGVTINKKFSFAVAKAGNNGNDGTSVTVSSTSVTYQVGTSGTDKPTKEWKTDIPSVPNGQYLWTKTVVNYSDGTSTEAYSVSYKAANGNDGTSVTILSTSVTYKASDNGTTAPTEGWSTNVPSVKNGEYLWTKTVVNYSDSKSTTSYSVSYKGTNGAKGDAGADAITLTITSSNGTIFKNNTGNTTLTAHVYKGAIEQTITDAGVVSGGLGTVKWYKGSTMTPVKAAKAITVSAINVTNSEVYTCQLE